MKPSSGRWAALAVVAMVAGCAAAPAQPPVAPAPAPVAKAAPPLMQAPPPQPKCHADGARFAIGKTVTPALEAAARERSDAMASRVLKPNTMTTMEFDDTRLNLVVDGHGKVTAVRCG